MPLRSDVSAERRTQIIQAAIACFLHKGYNNTTMDDIVAEGGLSKGSLCAACESGRLRLERSGDVRLAGARRRA